MIAITRTSAPMPAVASIFETLVARPGLRRSLEPDETLFRAGGKVTAVYVVASGRIRMVRTGRNGSEVTLHRASAGESFAEPSLFSERYHCDAIADVASEVVEYSKREVLQRLGREPERMMDLLRHLGSQVQALRARAEILSVHSASERLLAYFRLHVPASSAVLELATTWKQLAAELGLTHEALYRALRRLAEAGAIEREGTRVRLTGLPREQASPVRRKLGGYTSSRRRGTE